MTTLAKQFYAASLAGRPALRGFTGRAMAVAALVAAVSVVPGGWALAAEALSEAYLAVAVFVAGTLALVGFEGLIVGIQTLRLEYYEFLSKFFTGGGKSFSPLSLTNS